MALEVEVKNLKNEKAGMLVLNDSVFGLRPALPLLHEAVVMQLASMRQGTAATKTRGLVSGSGKKPWKQKGTGRARAGSSRSPVWRGGGIVFGPHPRPYGYAMPQKKSRKALHMALSEKVHGGSLIVLEAIEFEEVKTKLVARLLKELKLDGKVLMVTSKEDGALMRMVRNLPHVQILDIRRLNVYDILHAKWLVITREDVGKLTEILGDHEQPA